MADCYKKLAHPDLTFLGYLDSIFLEGPKATGFEILMLVPSLENVLQIPSTLECHG